VELIFGKEKVSVKNFLWKLGITLFIIWSGPHVAGMGPAVWLQVLSGLRPSEAQALRWESVDFELKQILIRAAFNNKENRIQEHPKQEDWGRAPMPEALMEYLDSLRRRRGSTKGFVVPSGKGEMLPYETYLRGLRPLCESAGVPIVTPHELRHSCTEIYVQAGASAEDVRRLLNQSSLTATARYMHRTEGRLSGIAAQVGREVGAGPSNPPTVHRRPVLRIVS
jgi:integrase